MNWSKYPLNPVVRRSAWTEWDSYRLSEVGLLFEDSMFYVYYTGIKYEYGSTTPTEGICLATVGGEQLEMGRR